MSLKNGFTNRLMQQGPVVKPLKDPSEAENFDLVNFDDNRQNISATTQGQPKLHTNSTQTPHRENLNSTQTPHRENLNSTQTPHRENLNSTQTPHRENLNSTQKKPKLHTELHTEKTQTPHKLHTNSTQKFKFAQLVGIKEKIVKCVYEECVKSGNRGRSKNGSIEGRVTHYLSPIYVANTYKIDKNSIPNTVIRLESMGLVYRGEGGITGRSARSIYVMPDDVFFEVRNSIKNTELHTNSTQTPHKLHTERHTERHTEGPSSSSFSYSPDLLKTITNGPDKIDQESPDSWDEINCSALQTLGVKFGKSQLKQVITWGKVTPEELQISIEAFAFDIEKNNKNFPSGRLNGFCGILKKGPYGPPDGFESNQDRELRENNERLLKYYQKKKDSEALARQLKYEAWLVETPRSELKAILPQSVQDLPFNPDSPMFSGILKTHFRDHVLLNLTDDQETKMIREIADRDLGPIEIQIETNKEN